jgi:hypothetical protein
MHFTMVGLSRFNGAPTVHKCIRNKTENGAQIAGSLKAHWEFPWKGPDLGFHHDYFHKTRMPGLDHDAIRQIGSRIAIPLRMNNLNLLLRDGYDGEWPW